jgi:hypothetical protein
MLRLHQELMMNIPTQANPEFMQDFPELAHLIKLTADLRRVLSSVVFDPGQSNEARCLAAAIGFKAEFDTLPALVELSHLWSNGENRASASRANAGPQGDEVAELRFGRPVDSASLVRAPECTEAIGGAAPDIAAIIWKWWSADPRVDDAVA